MKISSESKPPMLKANSNTKPSVSHNAKHYVESGRRMQSEVNSEYLRL